MLNKFLQISADVQRHAGGRSHINRRARVELGEDGRGDVVVGIGEDDDFNVLDTKEIAETMSGATRVLTALLGAVAAVSLLVGGIGIMNVMLVSVTERTREIGTRLAVGAREHEVLLQFLVEAITLSSVGGIVGILLATLASALLARVMQVPFLFNPQINTVAFIFSGAIGVMFGYLPARRAARLDPIEALRHE